MDVVDPAKPSHPDMLAPKGVRLTARKHIGPENLEDLTNEAKWAVSFNGGDQDDLMGVAKYRAIIQCGMENGVGVQASVANIYVIGGRTAMSSQLMRALAFNSGLVAQWDYEEKPIGDPGVGDQTGILTARRADNGSTRQVRHHLHDFADRIDNADPDSTWRRYPLAMLEARVTATMIRSLFPDVITGIMTVDEAEEVTGETIVEGIAGIVDADGVAAETAGAASEAGEPAVAEGAAAALTDAAEDVGAETGETAAGTDADDESEPARVSIADAKDAAAATRTDAIARLRASVKTAA